ncbi:MAG: hypothetical protein IPN71_01375 [Fibrobacteres bacterium]|nr:hypothetical protein [Fibrobacterota bacterium]
MRGKAGSEAPTARATREVGAPGGGSGLPVSGDASLAGDLVEEGRLGLPGWQGLEEVKAG